MGRARSALSVGWKEGRKCLINDALNTFFNLRLYGVRHMVKDHSDSEKGNSLPPHRLLCRMVCRKKKKKEMFYLTTHSTHLRLYGVRHMVKYHTGSERGNPLPPHGLLFPINSNGSFVCTIPQTGLHIPRPLLHQSWSTGWKEK